MNIKFLVWAFSIAVLIAYIFTDFFVPKDTSIKALTTYKEILVQMVDQVDNDWMVIGECLTKEKAVLKITPSLDVLEYASIEESGYCSKGTMIKLSVELRENSFLTVEPLMFLDN